MVRPLQSVNMHEPKHMEPSHGEGLHTLNYCQHSTRKQRCTKYILCMEFTQNAPKTSKEEVNHKKAPKANAIIYEEKVTRVKASEHNQVTKSKQSDQGHNKGLELIISSQSNKVNIDKEQEQVAKHRHYQKLISLPKPTFCIQMM